MKTINASHTAQKIPQLFKEIIKNDRELSELVSPKVIPISISEKYKELKQRKNDLIAAANRMYAPLKGDGTKGTA